MRRLLFWTALVAVPACGVENLREFSCYHVCWIDSGMGSEIVSFGHDHNVQAIDAEAATSAVLELACSGAPTGTTCHVGCQEEAP